LVYKVTGKPELDLKCTIVQCRYHYDRSWTFNQFKG